MVTAVFQGTLNVPLFDTGIVVTTPLGGLQLKCGTGDQPYYNTGVNGGADIYSRFGGGYQTTLVNTTNVLFNQRSAATLVIGNGSTSPVPGVQGSVDTGIMAAGKYCNSSLVQVDVGIPGFPGYLPIPLTTAFTTSKTTPSLNAQGADDTYELEGFFGLRNALNQGSSGAGFATNHGRPNISRASIIITRDFKPVGLTAGLGMSFFSGPGKMHYQFWANQLKVNGVTPTTYFDNANYNLSAGDWWNIPAPEIGGNYLWSGDASNTNVFIQTVFATCDIGSAPSFQVTFTATRDQVSFDSATLNALLGGGECGWNETANGMIFSTTQGSTFIDYYVSKDATKYWQINYIAAGAQLKQRGTYGSTIPAIGNDGNGTRWIDAQGVMWYVGDAVSGGGQTFVANSFGFNIPFNPLVLQYTPPVSFPCWSACLGRVGGSPGQANPFASNYGKAIIG